MPDKDFNDIEHILSNARFTPNPSFRASLGQRIQNQLDAVPLTDEYNEPRTFGWLKRLIGESRGQVNTSPNGIYKPNRQPTLMAALTVSGIALMVLALGIVAVILWRSGRNQQAVQPPEEFNPEIMAVPQDGELPTQAPLPTLNPVPNEALFGLQQLEQAGHLGRGSMIDAALSPDGSIAAVTTIDGVRAYDMATGTVLWEFLVETPQPGIMWTPDGSTVLFVWGGTLYQVEGQTGRIISEQLFGENSGNAIRPDGTQIATALTLLGINPSASRIFILDAASAEQQGSVDLSAGMLVSSMVWSPDGSQLGISTQTGEILLWDPLTDGPPFPISPQFQPGAVLAFSPDGTMLAAGAPFIVQGNTYALYDIPSAEWVYAAPGFDIIDLAWLPNGEEVAALDSNDNLYILNAQSGDIDRLLRQNNRRIPNARISLTEQGLLLYTSPDEMTLYDTQSGEAVGALDAFVSQPRTAAFSPDGSLLAVGSASRVYLFNPNTLGVQQTIQTPFAVEQITWAADSSRFAVEFTEQQASAFVYEVGSPVRVGVLDPTSIAIDELTWSPDGSQIAGGSPFGSVTLWDGGSYTEADRIDRDTPVLSLAWSRSSTRLAVGYIGPNEQRGIDIVTFDGEYGRMNINVSGDPHDLAWSPEGGFLAAMTGGSISVFNTSTGRTQWVQREPHTFGAESIAYSPLDPLIASGGQEIIIWNADNGDPLYAVPAFGRTSELAFSPGGRTLVGVNQDVGRVWLWRIP